MADIRHGEVCCEPGTALKCMGPRRLGPGKCLGYILTVPSGYVMCMRLLDPAILSPPGHGEFDKSCPKCKAVTRIRIVLDQRDQPATRSA